MLDNLKTGLRQNPYIYSWKLLKCNDLAGVLYNVFELSFVLILDRFFVIPWVVVEILASDQRIKQNKESKKNNLIICKHLYLLNISNLFFSRLMS